jgi:electron transfer flavoprotein beta subunit
MKILTLAMQVPDSRATLKLGADGKSVETGDLKLVCNPFDEFAVEQAVRFREAGLPIDEIVVATIGNAGSAQALRAALAMGADRGLHIVHDDLPMHDEILLASLLAEPIRLEPTTFDLILCGKQTIDNDAGILGPALAEFLDLPHIGAVVKLELAADGSSLRAHRRIEGAEEVFEMPLPGLVTCEKGLVEPRFPTLPNLMKAKKKPVTTLTEAELPSLANSKPALEMLSLEAPPPRPPCTIIDGEPAEMARELVRCLHEEAKVL